MEQAPRSLQISLSRPAPVHRGKNGRPVRVYDERRLSNSLCVDSRELCPSPRVYPQPTAVDMPRNHGRTTINHLKKKKRGRRKNQQPPLEFAAFCCIRVICRTLRRWTETRAPSRLVSRSALQCYCSNNTMQWAPSCSSYERQWRRRSFRQPICRKILFASFTWYERLPPALFPLFFFSSPPPEVKPSIF